MPSYLYDHLEKIKDTICKNEEFLLFLDYDGTLISFKDKPDKVFTPENTKKIIKNLAKINNINVFIITGRKLDNIKKLVDINNVSYAALHGMQIEFRNEENYLWPRAEKTQPLIKEIKEKAYKEFKTDKEIILEDKEYTLAFHYRMLPRGKIKVKTKNFLEIVKNIDKGEKLNIIKGDNVTELRPCGWDKGKAVETIIDRKYKRKRILPIYIGDDTTDEDAFKTLNKTGITVYVQNKSDLNTIAEYYLKNPDEVKNFLEKSFTSIIT